VSEGFECTKLSTSIATAAPCWWPRDSHRERRRRRQRTQFHWMACTKHKRSIFAFGSVKFRSSVIFPAATGPLECTFNSKCACYTTAVPKQQKRYATTIYLLLTYPLSHSAAIITTAPLRNTLSSSSLRTLALFFARVAWAGFLYSSSVQAGMVQRIGSGKYRAGLTLIHRHTTSFFRVRHLHNRPRNAGGLAMRHPNIHYGTTVDDDACFGCDETKSQRLL
jgi:hypothetical protein